MSINICIYICLCVLYNVGVYCRQTVAWIKMPLGTEVGVGLGDIVLDGDPDPPRKGAQQPPHFSAYVCCGQTVAHLSNLLLLSLSLL